MSNVIQFPGSVDVVNHGAEGAVAYPLDFVLKAAHIYKVLVKDDQVAEELLSAVVSAFRSGHIVATLPWKQSELVTKVINSQDPLAHDRHRQYLSMVFG